MGLFASLHLASRSLQASTAGIGVAGQNIANANTPGYIREDLKLTTDSNYKVGQVLYGTGVQVSGIRQVVNKFLETRLHAASSDSSASAAKSDIYSQLESALKRTGRQRPSRRASRTSWPRCRTSRTRRRTCPRGSSSSDRPSNSPATCRGCGRRWTGCGATSR